MAATAHALVLRKPRDLVLREIALPRVGDDDGVVRVEACGLCGTDHEQWSGALHPGYVFVPGHEIVGTVEAIGRAASRRLGVAEGDRIAVEVFQRCGTCDTCVAGEQQRCRAHGLDDMYGFAPVDRAPGLWGGYASHLYLAPHARVLPVSGGLDAILATAFNPVGAGIRWGARLPGTSAGDVVAVLGPGIRGLAVAAAAREAGAGFVMVTGKGTRDAPRLALAPAFGADLTVDVDEREPTQALRAATDGLADVVIDVTANAPDAPGQAVRLARPGGTVVLAGTSGGQAARDFVADAVVGKELRVLGALGVDSSSYRDALDLLASGRYPFASLSRRVAGLGDAHALLASMAGESDEPPPVHGVIDPTL